MCGHVCVFFVMCGHVCVCVCVYSVSICVGVRMFVSACA